ncbi:MAG TPA: penicillin-binding protein 1C [Candidatus Acidoferrales bacterium]|nr:penicillin-binding protein 1C [Candidatus Acidoferrales bacterium]
MADRISRNHAWQLTVGALLAALIISIFIPIPADRLSPLPVVSLRITDRNGVTLREVLSDQEGRAYWLRWNEIPPNLVKATVAVEDSRFYVHPGIDPISILRATYQDLRSLRFVSGGSTITQQVVRNIYHIPHSIFGKIIEAWYALRLERTLSKQEILLQYFNRVPYGNGTFGAEAASRLYFDKPASHLSLAEAAFMASLPNSPSVSNPYRSMRRALERKQFILKRMYVEKVIDENEYDEAAAEPINVVEPQRHFRAPHFTEMVLKAIPEEKRPTVSVVRTTLDYDVQNAVEAFLRGHIASLRRKHVTNGSVIVLDNSSGDVIALAGSVDFFDSTHDGQVNGALSLRQPGSTLKPFTYGIALESGLTPSDILPDLPYSVGGEDVAGARFSPENYDKKFHGPVRVRTALACSYNVPAIRVVERVGVDALLNRLHDAGFASLDRPASYYGFALTLGDGEVTLLELARAYSALARGGIFRNERIIIDERDLSGDTTRFAKSDSDVQVFSPQVSYILTNMLSDNDARIPAFGVDSPINFPFECAAKTGTSKDYKDNWTIGFTPRWTVGVWVGNFDGKPMRKASGITGAGPLFHDIMLYLEQRGTGGDFRRPPGLVEMNVCPASGLLPNKNCPGTMREIFIEGTEPMDSCDVHRLYKIDRRTGTLADASTPKQFTGMKLFEVFPPVFDEWASEEKIPRPIHKADMRHIVMNDRGIVDPGESEHASKSADPDFAITLPEDGAIYKIDPVLRREFQTIKVTIAAGVPYHDVELVVDGKVLDRHLGSSSYNWSLEEGEHSFQLIGEKDGKIVKSKVVHVRVFS